MGANVKRHSEWRSAMRKPAGQGSSRQGPDGNFASAGPAFCCLPTAALAAIIIWAAIRLIVIREYAFMWRFRSSEMLLAVSTALGVVCAVATIAGSLLPCWCICSRLPCLHLSMASG